MTHRASVRASGRRHARAPTDWTNGGPHVPTSAPALLVDRPLVRLGRPSTGSRSDHGVGLVRSGPGLPWTVTAGSLHVYACNVRLRHAGAGRRRLVEHTESYHIGGATGRGRPRRPGWVGPPVRSATLWSVRAVQTNLSHASIPGATAPRHSGALAGHERRLRGTNTPVRAAGKPRRAGASAQENFALISMTFAERLTTSGSSSSNRSPRILLVGPEMLTAPRTSASLSTGAATHRRPSIFSSSSIA